MVMFERFQHLSDKHWLTVILCFSAFFFLASKSGNVECNIFYIYAIYVMYLRHQWPMDCRCRWIAGQHLFQHVSHWCATQHFCEKQLFDNCGLNFPQRWQHEEKFSKPRRLSGMLVSNVLLEWTLWSIL